MKKNRNAFFENTNYQGYNQSFAMAPGTPQYFNQFPQIQPGYDELAEKIAKIERSIARLEKRITMLEDNLTTNNGEYNKSDNMYMI